MEIGLRSGGYWGAYAYEQMRTDGFTALNYADFASKASELYTLGEEELKRRMTACYQKAADAGIRINQTHGPCPTDDDTEENRRRMIGMTLQSMRGSAYLHAGDIVIHPAQPYGHETDPDPDFTWKCNLERIDALLPAAHELNLRLCIENLPYAACPIAHFEELCRLVELYDDPMFGLCLDTGHAACIGDDPAACVRRAGKKLYTTHVHDNNLKADQHLIPFAGRINWADFRAALQDIGFEGVVSIEANMPPQAPPELAPRLRHMLAQSAAWIAGLPVRP